MARQPSFPSASASAFSLFVRAVLATSATATLSACPEPARDPVGTSDKPRTTPKLKPEATPTSTAPADLRANVVALPGKAPSMGHASGRWEYTLSANDAGRAILDGKVKEASAGAKIVMDHFERSSGEKGPTMAMEKREKGFDPDHGDWRWIIVGTNGNLVFDGKTERCWGCHDDAPKDRDGVFPRHE